jgi:hypothetical protein
MPNRRPVKELHVGAWRFILPGHGVVVAKLKRRTFVFLPWDNGHRKGYFSVHAHPRETPDHDFQVAHRVRRIPVRAWLARLFKEYGGADERVANRVGRAAGS